MTIITDLNLWQELNHHLEVTRWPAVKLPWRHNEAVNREDDLWFTATKVKGCSISIINLRIANMVILGEIRLSGLAGTRSRSVHVLCTLSEHHRVYFPFQKLFSFWLLIGEKSLMWAKLQRTISKEGCMANLSQCALEVGMMECKALWQYDI